MSRITTIFSNLKKQNKKAFIPFITAGDGSLDNTYKLMQLLVANGANIIELGVPFSDPMADGPVIASSHERAVAANINLQDVLTLVKKFRQINTTTAIVLMSYLNPIEAFGYNNFAKHAKDGGVDGVLVIDMPAEEAHDLKTCLDLVDIDLIFLIALTTTDERIKYLATIASGFIYFISLKGVTGANHLDINLIKTHIVKIRKYINLPIGIGFGIKDANTARTLAKSVDAIIIGSSLVKFIEKYKGNDAKMFTSIAEFANKISRAINKE